LELQNHKVDKISQCWNHALITQKSRRIPDQGQTVAVYRNWRTGSTSQLTSIIHYGVWQKFSDLLPSVWQKLAKVLRPSHKRLAKVLRPNPKCQTILILKMRMGVLKSCGSKNDDIKSTTKAHSTASIYFYNILHQWLGVSSFESHYTSLQSNYTLLLRTITPRKKKPQKREISLTFITSVGQ
jgi:hypothetical protein